MRVFEVLTTENCRVRHVLDRIGDKWSTLTILMLGKHGKLRFNELSQVIGDVSQKMLTVTLRSLEADGLVSRKFSTLAKSCVTAVQVEGALVTAKALAAVSVTDDRVAEAEMEVAPADEVVAARISTEA